MSVSLRKHHARVATAVAAVSLSGIAAYAVPAFPGAEGFGASATGGRGGDVYHVTSLADTNTVGTLRYGVSHTPAAGRTIVFDVSGNIALTNNLSINKPNLTIAGQTAPGIGITVTGWQTSVSSSNVILRYMRFRPGDTYAPLKNPAANFQGDAFNVNGSSSAPASNIVIDHVSTSWGIDEDLSASYFNNVTVQNSIVAEGLANAGHTNDAGTGIEDHSMGSLIRYGSGSITFSHNLYESNRTRNPRVGDNIKLDFVNNVIYNWGGQSAYSGSASEGNTVLNYRGNYSVAGPNTSSTHLTRAFESGSSNTTIYQQGNYIDSNRNGLLDGADTGWTMITGAYTIGTGTFPAAAVPVTFESAPSAYTRVLATAGASLTRDSVDTRLVNTVRNEPGHNGAIIDSQDQVGGWDATPGTSRPAGWDTDGDGMPNAWEQTYGSNPNAADNYVLAADGYTALEHYLYWLVPSIGGDANGDMKLGRDDYALIDRGYAMHLTGWGNGDFNADGVVDAADYLILDAGVAARGAMDPAVLAERETQFGPGYVADLLASVPEPSVGGFTLAAGVCVLRRRRGRWARSPHA